MQCLYGFFNTDFEKQYKERVLDKRLMDLYNLLRVLQKSLSKLEKGISTFFHGHDKDRL